MTFLTINDFNRKASEEIINQITGSDDTLLEDAESGAIGIITDKLSQRYNIPLELSRTGSSRHQALLMWLLNIAIYLLYERIPDDEIPERVVKDYDDTMSTITSIARGKEPTTLATISVDGEAKRVFRMGSNTKRSHDML